MMQITNCCGAELTDPLTTCCGASDRETYYKGPSYEDIGFCPECRDHTEFRGVCVECGEPPQGMLNVEQTPGGYYVTGPDGPDSVVGHGTTIHDAFCDYIEQDADANEKYREAA